MGSVVFLCANRSGTERGRSFMYSHKGIAALAVCPNRGSSPARPLVWPSICHLPSFKSPFVPSPRFAPFISLFIAVHRSVVSLTSLFRLLVMLMPHVRRLLLPFCARCPRSVNSAACSTTLPCTALHRNDTVHAPCSDLMACRPWQPRMRCCTRTKQCIAL
jgi:hypothetical protein